MEIAMTYFLCGKWKLCEIVWCFSATVRWHMSVLNCAVQVPSGWTGKRVGICSFHLPLHFVWLCGFHLCMLWYCVYINSMAVYSCNFLNVLIVQCLLGLRREGHCIYKLPLWQSLVVFWRPVGDHWLSQINFLTGHQNDALACPACIAV